MKYILKNVRKLYIVFLIIFSSCNSKKEKQKFTSYSKQESGATNQIETEETFAEEIYIESNIVEDKTPKIKTNEIFPATIEKMEGLLDKLPSFLLGKDGQNKLKDKKLLENLENKKNEFKDFLREYRTKDSQGQLAAIKGDHFFQLFIDKIKNDKKPSTSKKITDLKTIKEYSSLEEYLKAVENLKTSDETKSDKNSPWGEFIDENITKQLYNMIQKADEIFKENNNKSITSENCNLKPIMQKGIGIQKELMKAISDVLKTKPAKDHLLHKIKPSEAHKSKGNTTRVAIMIDLSTKKLDKLIILPIEKAASEIQKNKVKRAAINLRQAFNEYIIKIEEYKKIDPEGEALRKLIYQLKEKGKKSIPIFGGMMKMFLFISKLKSKIKKQKNDTSITSMVKDTPSWEKNFDRIIRYVNFGKGLNAIATPFNKIWYSIKRKEGINTNKGMKALFNVSKKEYKFAKIFLTSLRNNQDLTVKAFLNKKLV